MSGEPTLPAAPPGFGRERRVRKRRDFLRIQGEGRRVTTRHFVLLVSARPEPAPGRARTVPGSDGPGPARLGLVVTRKIGNAVARNRVKRVCRECFRLWPAWLPDGVDLVVVARTGADALGLADTRAEWAAVSGLVRKRAEEALAHVRPMPHGSVVPRRPRAPKP